MVKIIAGLLSPTAGTVVLTSEGREVPFHDRFLHVGFVAPYLQLYDEFTAYENLDFFRRIRGTSSGVQAITALLEEVGLASRKHDLVRTFSSGMKQRLKFAFAMLHNPPVLILDEPRSNLDEDGIRIVYDILRRQRTRGIVIVATNDHEDLGQCDRSLDLNRFTERGLA